jgi:putative transposase
VTPAAQREAVRALRAQFAFSERRACRLVGMARATCQYRSRLDLATPLRERLRVLAEHRRRFGYRRLTVLLRREGLRVNHKRIYRLYREEGLAVRRRKRKRLSRIAVPPLPAVTRLNQRWTMDFIEDRLVTGRKFRTFNVVDAFSRKGLASEVDTSLPGARVVQVLDRLAETRGRPKELILDNGPEFIGRALDQWADSRGVRLRFIAPGKPVQNAHIESFHGRFRDECLNESVVPDPGGCPADHRGMAPGLQHRAAPQCPGLLDARRVRADEPERSRVDARGRMHGFATRPTKRVRNA